MQSYLTKVPFYIVDVKREEECTLQYYAIAIVIYIIIYITINL